MTAFLTSPFFLSKQSFLTTELTGFASSNDHSDSDTACSTPAARSPTVPSKNPLPTIAFPPLPPSPYLSFSQKLSLSFSPFLSYLSSLPYFNSFLYIVASILYVLFSSLVETSLSFTYSQASVAFSHILTSVLLHLFPLFAPPKPVPIAPVLVFAAWSTFNSILEHYALLNNASFISYQHYKAFLVVLVFFLCKYRTSQKSPLPSTFNPISQPRPKTFVYTFAIAFGSCLLSTVSYAQHSIAPKFSLLGSFLAILSTSSQALFLVLFQTYLSSNRFHPFVFLRYYSPVVAALTFLFGLPLTGSLSGFLNYDFFRSSRVSPNLSFVLLATLCLFGALKNIFSVHILSKHGAYFLALTFALKDPFLLVFGSILHSFPLSNINISGAILIILISFFLMKNKFITTNDF
ncbi:hypothetical protein BB559_004958 [Furculomyces boomerangus]|uniref:Sugar phosphate transporter domain-containing protein n=1 Tax=Furculomyces boomerangus TaxID=61424 RepID=A0A2T9YBQ4_9FUNG|nr:hypothetical protein BB559_004958 [Furculomyces boomerangus]